MKNHKEFKPYPVQIPGTKQFIDIAPFLNLLQSVRLDPKDKDYEISLIELSNYFEKGIRLLNENANFDIYDEMDKLNQKDLFYCMYKVKDLFEETMIIEQGK